MAFAHANKPKRIVCSVTFQSLRWTSFSTRSVSKKCAAVKGWAQPFFFVFSSSSFFFFCESDDRQLFCLHITDTTPYSCGRRKFSLACSHAQRPLRNLQSLLLRLIQPVPLQIICCQKQFFSPDLLRFIGLMFNKKYAERKYTLSFLWEYIL